MSLMRKTLVLACMLSLAACATKYGEWKAGKIGGYKDKQLAPDSWQVTAQSTSQSGPTFSIDMALFRGAVLAKAGGYDIMHVVNFEIVDDGVYGVTTNQSAKLTLLGTNDPGAPLSCRAKGTFVSNCRILGVEQVLQEMGPRMGLSRQQIGEEVSRASEKD